MGRGLAPNLQNSNRFRAVTSYGVEVSGQPGALLMTAGRVVSVMALEIADGRVQGIRSIVNPDKLGHVGEVADWDLLLKGRLG